MTQDLTATPLTAADFAPFGEVITPRPAPDMIINAGRCGRHHDLARMDFGTGRAGISLFDAEARHWPVSIDLLERHPLGSQAFIPVTGTPFLVVVAGDADGIPATPRAFLTAPGQGINLHRNVWHAVLTPIGAPGLYAVVDRIGAGNNLEEYYFKAPLVVTCAG